LGWGFDATYRDPFFALKPQLFQFSYNCSEYKSYYRYPLDVQTYAVPKEVFVRTVSKTTTYTYSFKDSREKRMVIDGRLNLKVSTKQLDVELEVAVNYVKSSDTNTSIVFNFVETSLFQLYLGKRVIGRDLTEALVELRGTYSLDPLSYELFLSRFGTHYVDSIVIGGSIQQETIIKSSSEEERLQITASLKGRFESASGKDSGTSSVSNSNSTSGSGGGSGGGTQVNGSLTFKYEDIERKIDTETTSNSEIYGGDPEFTDFVLTAGDPATTKQLFESWKKTLVTNPIGIRYRLVETWSLLEDPQQQKEMCTASATILGFLPNEDPKYCASAGQLLGGSIRGGLEPPPSKGKLQ